MVEAHLYLAAAMAYGLLGALLCVVYWRSRRVREEPVAHALTLLAVLLACAVANIGASALPADPETFPLSQAGARFFLFFGASLLYVPVIVFLLLHYWESLLERVTSPGSRRERPREPRTRRQMWRCIQAHLDALTADPTNPAIHERLADLYARMGFLDSSLYEYQKAAAWLQHGYAQGHVLYKAARLLVEQKQDLPAAVTLLRRIVRIYPRSYFASYARRILSRYEAHSGSRKGSSSSTHPPGPPSPRGFPPGREDPPGPAQ